MSRESGWYRTIKNGLDKSNPINWEIIYYYANVRKWETGDICDTDEYFTATRYVDKLPVNPVPADEVESFYAICSDLIDEDVTTFSKVVDARNYINSLSQYAGRLWIEHQVKEIRAVNNGEVE